MKTGTGWKSHFFCPENLNISEQKAILHFVWHKNQEWGLNIVRQNQIIKWSWNVIYCFDFETFLVGIRNCHSSKMFKLEKFKANIFNFSIMFNLDYTFNLPDHIDHWASCSSHVDCWTSHSSCSCHVVCWAFTCFKMSLSLVRQGVR